MLLASRSNIHTAVFGTAVRWAMRTKRRNRTNEWRNGNDKGSSSFLRRKSKYRSRGMEKEMSPLAVCASLDLVEVDDLAKMDVRHSSCRDFSDNL